eukprot:SAG31_NODE_3906_length_3765_cov_1.595745_1_plen_131_part_00
MPHRGFNAQTLIQGVRHGQLVNTRESTLLNVVGEGYMSRKKGLGALDAHPQLLHCEGVVFDPRTPLGLTLTGGELAKMTSNEFAAFHYHVSVLMGDLAHWNHQRAPDIERIKKTFSSSRNCKSKEVQRRL